MTMALAVPTEIGAPSGAANSTRYQWLLVTLISFTYGIVFFDRNALNFLMPYVQPELRLSGTQVGLVASALSLTWAASAYAIGRLADATGRRKLILVVSTTVFSVASLLTGFADSFFTLLAVRLLMGMAEGGVLPVSLSIVASEIDEKRRALAMGIAQNLGSSLLGTFVAPIVLIVLAERYGWRPSFMLAAVPGLVMAGLILMLMREFGHDRGGSRAASPLTLGDALGIRNVVLCMGIAITCVSFFLVTMVFVPLFLVQTRGISKTEMSWLLAMLGIASTVGSIALPALSDRIGRKPVMIAGMLISLALPLSLAAGNLPFWALAAACAIGWMPISLFPLFMGTIPSETVGPARAASAIGLVMGCGESIGGVLSPALMGMLADAAGLKSALIVLAGLGMAGAALATMLAETRPPKQTQI